jgi:hypothetical protein
MLRNWLSRCRWPPPTEGNHRKIRQATAIAVVQKTQLFDGGTISFVETLYLSSKGVWFLAHAPGQRTTALDAQEAFTWLWQHHQVEMLRRHFPERLERS